MSCRKFTREYVTITPELDPSRENNRHDYYWPSLAQDAHKYTTSCDQCQRFANVLKQPLEPIANIMSPWPFVQWGIDLIEPLPPSNGQTKFVVVVVDYFIE